MIIEVDERTISPATEIYFESWKASHSGFCTEEFINQHTLAYQKLHLQNELNTGKILYMLIKEKPVGIVSVKENLIENLYILPSEHRKGYGTELLLFAIEQCRDSPSLWILDNNHEAYSLYSKHGFRLTGSKHVLSNTISEVEMKQEDFAK